MGSECCVCVSWGCGMCGAVCVVCELGVWSVLTQEGRRRAHPGGLEEA